MLSASSSEVSDNCSDEDALYVPSPTSDCLRYVKPIPFPKGCKLAVIDVNAIDKFVDTINAARKCATPSCRGILVCSSLRMKGMGGSVEIIYVCNGCGSHDTIFTGCDVHKSMRTTTIGSSIMLAFIISGCLFSTYYKTMKLALGINCYKYTAYKTMLKRLHPVVKGMVDEMCNDAKDDMKKLDQTKLGSWKQAVTSADGVWQTRRFHSKNGTFNEDVKH